MLPDRSVLIGQKLVENAKIEKFKCDILGDFQTLCEGLLPEKPIEKPQKLQRKSIQKSKFQ